MTDRNETIDNSEEDKVTADGVVIKQGKTKQFLGFKSFIVSLYDESNEITIDCSNWTGKEVVSFNGDIVAEVRSFGLSSKHIFEKDGHVYQLLLFLSSMSAFEIMLIKDDKVIASDILSFKLLKKKERGLAWFILIGLALAIGFTSGYFVTKYLLIPLVS